VAVKAREMKFLATPEKGETSALLVRPKDATGCRRKGCRIGESQYAWTPKESGRSGANVGFIRQSKAFWQGTLRRQG
jgi:hypothetical protein